MSSGRRAEIAQRSSASEISVLCRELRAIVVTVSVRAMCPRRTPTLD